MIPKILALDTTAEHGSIGLASGDQIVSELAIHAPQGFGQILFQRIAELLSAAGWTLDDIDCFAAAAGPGSFTGVRVGLAAVKGLADAMDKPAVAVSNLQAIAYYGTAPLRATVLDARRGEIYGGLYDSNLELVSPEVVTGLPEWLETLPGGDIEFLSTDCSLLRAGLAGTRFESAPARETPRAIAGSICRIAARRFVEGKAEDPAALDANYVRRSDAELFWRDL